jgi:hypothetical protein
MYVTTTLCGGLGNMMFQMSAGWAYAKRFGKKFRYARHAGSLHDRDLSLFNFATDNFIKCSEGVEFGLYSEADFAYSPIPELDGNISLEGYFQSSKYFNDVLTRRMLREKFNCSSKKERYPFIHIRRGDYLSKSNYHTVLPLEYYERAMSVVKSDKYYIVSDDMGWVKTNFHHKSFVYFEEPAIDCFQLMASCDRGIIANSTFSWWGAYLSHSPKTYVAPKNWFGPKGPSNHDLYEKDWFVL